MTIENACKKVSGRYDSQASIEYFEKNIAKIVEFVKRKNYRRFFIRSLPISFFDIRDGLSGIRTAVASPYPDSRPRQAETGSAAGTASDARGSGKTGSQTAGISKCRRRLHTSFSAIRLHFPFRHVSGLGQQIRSPDSPHRQGFGRLSDKHAGSDKDRHARRCRIRNHTLSQYIGGLRGTRFPGLAFKVSP